MSDDAADIDPAAAAEIVGRALAVVGGPDLVVGSLATLPGAEHTPARSGMFRSVPEQVLIGQWRYSATRDGRLTASHVVGGIVIAESTLPAGEAALHVAKALSAHIHDHGSKAADSVRSMLEGLDVGAGP